MGVSELRKLLEDYNGRAKNWNVSSLAVSALIKKLVIADFPFHDSVHADVLEFAKSELEQRFQRLFADLVEAKTKAVEQDDLRQKIEVELFAVRHEIDKADEVDEAVVIIYESGVEAANQLDQLAAWDVHDIVNYTRSHSTNFRKVSELTEFLERNFEEKLNLSIISLP